MALANEMGEQLKVPLRQFVVCNWVSGDSFAAYSSASFARHSCGKRCDSWPNCMENSNQKTNGCLQEATLGIVEPKAEIMESHLVLIKQKDCRGQRLRNYELTPLPLEKYEFWIVIMRFNMHVECPLPTLFHFHSRPLFMHAITQAKLLF